MLTLARTAPPHKKGGWLEIRLLIDALRDSLQGVRMPTNADSDRLLNRPLNEFIEAVSFWNNSVLVTPARGTSFGKGDFNDPQTDPQGRKWALPASAIPPEAVGVKSAALFLDNPVIEIDDVTRSVFLLPREVHVLIGIPPIEEVWAHRDPHTGIPLVGLANGTSAEDLRQLRRTKHNGIRPIYRIAGEPSFFKTVGADYFPGAIKSGCVLHGEDSLLLLPVGTSSLGHDSISLLKRQND